jgi:hypothetical protein
MLKFELGIANYLSTIEVVPGFQRMYAIVSFRVCAVLKVSTLFSKSFCNIFNDRLLLYLIFLTYFLVIVVLLPDSNKI